MPIYSLHNEGLGDHWASISLLARMSISQGKLIMFHSKPQYQKQRHREILNLMDFCGALVCPSAEPADVGLDGAIVWAAESLPTRKRWEGLVAKPFICLHVEGESSAADKNPNQEEIDRICSWALSEGLRVERLSGQISLPTMVDLLSRCALFVGCDSGPSHVAHSVGTPTYLLEYNMPVVTCHRHKAYVRCDGVEHFRAQASAHIHYLRHVYGLPGLPG